eukprot:1141460-Pelagomonas_calceolata.AAC.7
MHPPFRAEKIEPVDALHTMTLPSEQLPSTVLLLGDHTSETTRPAPVRRVSAGRTSARIIKRDRLNLCHSEIHISQEEDHPAWARPQGQRSTHVQ